MRHPVYRGYYKVYRFIQYSYKDGRPRVQELFSGGLHDRGDFSYGAD